jgi:hypothetical protein
VTEEPEDEIIAEIRRRREAHAASFDFDLKRIREALRKEEVASGVRVVLRSPRAPDPLRKRSPA